MAGTGSQNKPLARWISAVIVGVCLTAFGIDTWQQASHRGAYATGWQGRVVSGRPTVWEAVDFVRHNGRTSNVRDINVGHYQLTIEDAGGKQHTYFVAEDVFYRAPIGGYAVSRDTSVYFFPSINEARSAYPDL